LQAVTTSFATSPAVTSRPPRRPRRRCSQAPSSRSSSRGDFRRERAFAPAGLCFGLSYVFLFEAFFHGRVTVVAPLVATESLWGVGLSALLLRHTELVGKRLVLGALLIVAGGVLIGIGAEKYVL
jgi:drug/metabolite transporter (DMT)-like permease